MEVPGMNESTIETTAATIPLNPTRPDVDSATLEKFDGFSLEQLVDIKIGRFLDQLGKFYPEELYDLIMSKVEKPLIGQILKRTGGNQVHASKILGINRNTLRKKMKIHGLVP